MCGIAGFIGTGTFDDLKRMNEAQRSRGPDAEGHFCDPDQGIYLGHLRLSILDLGGGAQPMWTADGALGIVFNGEIYNHSDLRKELVAAGASFRSDHSDTEVLLHAYRQWGDDFVERLNGMWAFVIYDRARQRLFASRDRFGKKPFYYTQTKGLFAFASELRAIAAHSGVIARPSPMALRKYFAYGYIPAPWSYLDAVFKLPGGCNLEFDLRSSHLKTWRYWQFRLEPEEPVAGENDQALAEKLKALITSAVNRRLISDVPIGAFLSGGIDSSTVSALAARSIGADRLETFSIGFDDPSFDESDYARRVAEQIGSRHHHRLFTEAEARADLAAVVARLDEPMGDSSLLPTSFLCRHAREFVTVALGGDGADELFAGYDPFLALRWADLYRRWVPRPVHQAIGFVVARMPVSHRNMSLDFRIKRTMRGLDFPPRLWCPVWMAPLAPDELSELFQQTVDCEEVYADAIETWESCTQPDIASHVLEFYTRFYLQDDILAKVDRASMAHSLEVRAPFLDIELVDFVRRLPLRYKLDGSRTKSLLRTAATDLIPADIIERPKKGFGVPVGRWFRDGTLPLPQKVPAGLAVKFLQDKGAAHVAGRADERAFLWNAYLLDAGGWCA